MKKRPAQALAEVAAHIRGNLDARLDLSSLASHAGLSSFHFHRIFRAVFGEPVAAYVRRERLQRAARRLRTGNDDVTRVALDAGYETPSAFARAFKEHFGVPPSGFAASEVPVVPEHAMPRFRSEPMAMRVEELAPQRLLGVLRKGSYRRMAPQAFEALLAIAGPRGLIGPQTKFLGLSHDDPESCDEADLRYEACIASDAEPSGELRRIAFAGGPYAVYRHVGPYELIEHVFDRLFDAVIFSGNYELREAPCVEINLNDPQITDPSELLTDVCIPIR